MTAVKKHVKKFVKHRRLASWRKRKKLQRPLAFASVFAVVMVAYGLSLIIFAATSAQFSLTPATQTVSPGQTKTINVHFDPKGNNVKGGKVTVTFDPARLAYVTATAADNTGAYYITSGSAGTNSYTFNFSTWYTTQQAVDFGTITFTVKAATGTVGTSLGFTAASTYSYFTSSNNHTAANYTGATMTVQGTPPPAPEKCALDNSLLKTDPKCTPCPYNSRIIASNSSCKAPTTGGGTTTTTTKPPTGTGSSGSGGSAGSGSSSTPTAPGGSGVADLPEQPADEPSTPSTDAGDTDKPTSEPIAAKKKSPLKAILFIILGLLILVACAFIYFIRFRPKGSKVKSKLKPSNNLHGGLFDDAAAPVAGAGAILASKQKQPAHAANLAEKIPQPLPAAAAPTPPVPKHAPEAPKAAEPPQPPAAAQEPAATPAAPAPTPPAVPETDKATPPVTPPAPEPIQAAPAPTPPVQATTAQPEPDQAAGQGLSPADQIAQAALANIAAHKGPTLQESMAKEGMMPLPPQPAWQKNLSAKKSKSKVEDEPEDMFELAEDHPGSFGSTQIAEAEDVAKGKKAK